MVGDAESVDAAVREVAPLSTPETDTTAVAETSADSTASFYLSIVKHAVARLQRLTHVAPMSSRLGAGNIRIAGAIFAVDMVEGARVECAVDRGTVGPS